MGQSYLIDSNVIIDYTANRIPEKGTDFFEKIIQNQFVISVIVKIEVLGFNDFPHKLYLLEKFISLAEIIPLQEQIVEKAILLRRKYKKLKLGDAIIAATALVYNLAIITRNISDFQPIENLQVVNLYEI